MSKSQWAFLDFKNASILFILRTGYMTFVIFYIKAGHWAARHCELINHPGGIGYP